MNQQTSVYYFVHLLIFLLDCENNDAEKMGLQQ